MKNTLCLYIIFFFSPLLGYSQAPDTLILVKKVDSLIQASRFMADLKLFEEAFALNAEAEKVATQCCGQQSAVYGTCWQNLGRIYCIQEEFPDAEKWLMKAKELYEKVLTKPDANYGLVLNNLAEANRRMGKFVEAGPLYRQAFDVWNKVPDTSRQFYGKTAFNYGNFQKEMGNFESAISYYNQAKEIWQKPKSGEALVNYAACLNSLGALYYSMGDFKNAERYYLEVKPILENLPVRPNIQYAGCLTNMGALYRDMGDYVTAESLFQEATGIWKRAAKQNMRDYAACLTNHALLLFVRKQFEQAEERYQEALSILEKSPGKTHPDYITCLNDLAVLFEAKGDDNKADSLYRVAISTQEKETKRNEALYANCINNLAILYYKKGKFEKAKPLFLQAKSIRERALGKEHPDYAASLTNMAILYRDMDQPAKAAPFLTELALLNQNLMNKALLHLSERELGHYIATFSEGYDVTMSVAASLPGSTLNATCYNNSLFYKGFLLNASIQLGRLALRDSATTEAFYQLKEYRHFQYLQLALPKVERDTLAIAQLEDKANALEKDLARRVAGFREALRQVQWEDVQRQLKSGDAAIEFVQYRVNTGLSDKTSYAALLVRPGDHAPQFIPLFQEQELAGVIAGASGKAIRKINNLYLGKEKKNLYNLIWEPLAPHLQGVKTIYCAPSGMLHRINLGAIAINSDSCFSEKYRLVTMSSTRLLVLPDTTTRIDKDAVLIGGVRYASDSLAISKANDGFLNDHFYDPPQVYPEPTRGDSLTYLPETLREVLDIQQLLQAAGWSTTVDTGYHATEERFCSLGLRRISPRILNLATHGFFFPDPKQTGSERLSWKDAGPEIQHLEHPMIRSGLLLAGSEAAWETGRHPASQADGILRAYEISQMNLSNTELVVLSACETGLGEIDDNEGVYGLQRAFKIAGAKYLLLSLWKVQDLSTNEFIQEFYHQWILNQLTIPEAFRMAQNNLKRKYVDAPYLWAGFILVE